MIVFLQGTTDEAKQSRRFCVISMNVSEICLASPCYHNGNVVSYLKGGPNIDRWASCIETVQFMTPCDRHVGASLFQRRLIDDTGNTQLSTAAHSSVVALRLPAASNPTRWTGGSMTSATVHQKFNGPRLEFMQRKRVIHEERPWSLMRQDLPSSIVRIEG